MIMLIGVLAGQTANLRHLSTANLNLVIEIISLCVIFNIEPVHQSNVTEETPAPGLDRDLREEICQLLILCSNVIQHRAAHSINVFPCQPSFIGEKFLLHFLQLINEFSVLIFMLIEAVIAMLAHK